MELRELLTQVFTGSLSAQIELISTFQDFGYNIKLIKIEEETKMLNVDKYRKEIDLMIENGAKPRYMILRMCLEKTNLESVDTAEVLDWLFSEYEPPLLKNGDDLKPGDWIMVRDRDGDKWQKRHFMCYFQSLDRSFVTLEEMHGWYIGKHECWKQARLPMDGE